MQLAVPPTMLLSAHLDSCYSGILSAKRNVKHAQMHEDDDEDKEAEQEDESSECTEPNGDEDMSDDNNNNNDNEDVEVEEIEMEEVNDVEAIEVGAPGRVHLDDYIALLERGRSLQDLGGIAPRTGLQVGPS